MGSNVATGGLARREVMTLVFTDLVGSTRLKEELGNSEALRLIHEHHAIVRQILGCYPEGFEISTAGDSFFLAFRKPSDAVSFALRLQTRLHLWNRRNRRKVLDRVGIHAGEVTVEVDTRGDIRDLHGLEVDKCARVMSLGRENHILLTRFAFENARASLKGERIPDVGEVEWVTHGPYQLKGVAEPIEICEVSEAGRTTLEPPPDSDKAHRVAPATETGVTEVRPAGWRGWTVGRRVPARTSWIGAGVTAAVGLLVLVLPLFRWVTDWSYDLPYLFRSEETPPEAVIVRMDTASEQELGQPSDHRWDRRMHAALLRKLAESSPRAVVFDVWFSGETTPAEDEALVEAAKAFGRVAVAGRLLKDMRHGFFAQESVQGPFAGLAAVSVWGLSHFPVSLDQVVRRPHRGAHNREHLAVAVARMLGKEPPADTSQMWLNYYGPPGTLDAYSYAAVMTNLVPSEVFSNRVVFVGAVNLNNPGFTEGWLNDEGATPYTRWTGRTSPGVEIMATTTLNLLRGDGLRRLAPWVEVVWIAGLGLAIGWGLTRLRPFPAVIIALGGAVVLAGSSIAAVWWLRLWYPWLVVVGVMIPVALAWSAVVWADASGRLAMRSVRTGTMSVAPATRTRTRHVEVDGGGGSREAEDGRMVIPGYDLLREIGRGAYGRVWLARDVVGMLRAVKVVQRRAFESDRPYEREFTGIKRFTPISLEHPGLIRVLHVGRDDERGCFYYVMEAADDELNGAEIDPGTYVPRTLAGELVRLGRLPVKDAARLAIGLGEALEFMHQRHLVHRDIKPANILYVRGLPKLGDIGLVTEMAGTDQAVSFLGTQGYLAPEGPGTAAADVYALGKLLYVAATGRGPLDYPQPAEGEADWGHSAEGAGWVRVWSRACEPDPARRLGSVAEMVRELREQLDKDPREI